MLVRSELIPPWNYRAGHLATGSALFTEEGEVIDMEIRPGISFAVKGANMIWIYAIYRIFLSRVKRQGLNLLVCAYKKRGKSMPRIHPSDL